MATPTPDSYTFTPGTTLYAGLPTPPVGTLLQTLRLVNTSSSAQSADFVTKSFGLQFKQGDLPAGEWPEFRLSGGALCAPTISEVTAWPDGSMKKCAVFMRVPASVPGSSAYSASVAFSARNPDFSSIPVEVYSGGSAPAAGTRTTADLTAADLKVELAGITNLSGTWVAELNAAITDGADVVTIASGPAGSYFRIGMPFKQSATAHEQLYNWWYIFALTNSSGGLSHLRRMERVAQPWANVSAGTRTRRTVNCVVKSGATTIRTMTGHTTTETPGANINVPHWSGFFCVGTDGEYEFLQGGGSASADCTIRVVYEPARVIRSRLFQSFDTSVVPTPGAQRDYYPGGAASMLRDMRDTGDREDIGVLPAWTVRYLLSQSGVDERNMRVTGMVQSGWSETRRVRETRQIIPATDFRPAGYAGLGANRESWTSIGAGEGILIPTDNGSLWIVDSSHRPNTCYAPYLMTGERQYIDMMVEAVASVLTGIDVGTRVMNTALPITSLYSGFAFKNIQIGTGGPVFKNAGMMWFEGGVRQSAWLIRDLAGVAALLPDTCPEATDVKVYFNDALDQTYAAMNALNATRPQSWRDSGLMVNTNVSAPGSGDSGGTGWESTFMTLYLSSSVCFQSQITNSPTINEFRAHLGRLFSSAHANFDISMLASYRWKQWLGPSGNLVMDINDAAFAFNPSFAAVSISFDATTNRGTLSGLLGTTATDGDIYSPAPSSTKPAPGMVGNQNYYFVNCSGATFQLSATPGGSVIDIPSNVTITEGFVQLADTGSQRNLSGDGNYGVLLYDAIRSHEASGDTFVNSARVKQDIPFAGASFVSNPRNAVLPAYPA